MIGSSPATSKMFRHTMNQPFVHLRVHSEYSLSDGIVRIKPLVAAAAEMGSPAVAVTDRNNLFALIKFYNAAHDAGVKPIVGCDVLIEPEGDELPSTLVLLARDDAGYRSLCEVLSRGYLEGQHDHVPVLQRSWLEEHATGLIALSAAAEGDVGRALAAGRVEQAQARLRAWMDLFPDRYYLELHRTGRPGGERLLHRTVELATELGCPVVATNDVRFLAEDEFEAHEVRVCIHEGRILDDARRPRNYSAAQYLKTPAQMVELFSDIPEAVENSLLIAQRCNVDIELGKNYLPEYPVPEGQTAEAFFVQVSQDGLGERLLTILEQNQSDYAELRQRYQDRLDFELGVINRMGFAGYFLIVMEFIQWAKEHNIPVGPGRGSGAASLVAYALKITDIDPLEYDLLFERFLNPERVSMPDFDIDFCMDGRDQVIVHVTELYGAQAVSQIITFGTMAAKAVVRDVARVQGKPYGLADRLSKLIPFDPGMTLTKALEEEPLLREFVDNNADAQEIMEMAFKIEGITRNVGKHAGGVVIAPTRLTDFSPVYCDESGGNLMTQFDKDDVERAGLVKFDFLGLRTLTIIHNAVIAINVRRVAAGEAPIDMDSLALDDPRVYKMLQEAKTTAVFQLESRGMKDLMKKVLPSRFMDIVALVALFRPGPMQLADDFINRKHGREEVDYLHPDLEPALKDTYGVMLYQEQVMQIAQVLSGYTLADADLLRRAMGKKKPEEMAKQKSRFIDGATERGVDAAQADHIFSLMEKFAGYGFNKPHSVAYALIAYQTAWLKLYFPADFMAAVLSADMQTTDKVITNIDECSALNVKVIPPDVNRGEFRFTAPDNNTVVYGLGAIKGLGEGAIEALVQSRVSDGAFGDLFDFCERVDPRRVNRRALDALVGSGALDALAPPSGLKGHDHLNQIRSVLALNAEDALKSAEQKARNEDSGNLDLFGDVSFARGEVGERYTTAGLRVMKFKDRLEREKETLGLYLTGHPIEVYGDEVRRFAKTRIVDLRVSNDSQSVVGLVVGLRTMRSKRGDTLAFLTLDDRSGRIEVSVTGDTFDANHGKLRKDAVLVVHGSTAVDDFTGGLRMRASQVFDIREARQNTARRLAITIFEHRVNGNFVNELAGLLAPFKTIDGAGCPVAVAYRAPSAQADVALGDSWRVKPDDDLITILQQRYGSTEVRLDY